MTGCSVSRLVPEREFQAVEIITVASISILYPTSNKVSDCLIMQEQLRNLEQPRGVHASDLDPLRCRLGVPLCFHCLIIP